MEYPEELRRALGNAQQDSFPVEEFNILGTFNSELFSLIDLIKIRPVLHHKDTKFSATIRLNNNPLVVTGNLPLSEESRPSIISLAQSMPNSDLSSSNYAYASEFWCMMLEFNPQWASVSFKVQYSKSNIFMVLKMDLELMDSFYLETELTARDSFEVANALARGAGKEATVLATGEGYGFPWPSTDIDPGQKDLKLVDAPEKGYLKHLGYSVGEQGKLQGERRWILERAFLSSLPTANTEYTHAIWGSPGSCNRLKKIAYSIASFTKLKKRSDQRNSSARYEQAIRDWEADLRWLKESYYQQCRGSFPWPNT